MKKIIFAFVLLIAGFTSCDNIEEMVNSILIPSEATPSRNFNLGVITTEEHAADARLFTTSQSNAPFTSIEFFGDGHYLMTGSKATRANTAEVYGIYDVKGTLHYTLDNGDVIDATSLDGPHGTITYTPHGGEPVSVTIASAAPLTSEASKCFCRSWGLENSKYWLGVNGFLALHRNYYMEGGKLKHDDNKVGNFIGEFYQGDLITPDRWPETITISPFGTYFVKFASGKTLMQEWSWKDEFKGTIKTASNDDFNLIDFLKNHDVTIRFVDDKLVLYTDYSIQSTSVYNANTFAPILNDQNSGPFYGNM